MGLRAAGEGACPARILWAGPPPRTPTGVRVTAPIEFPPHARLPPSSAMPNEPGDCEPWAATVPGMRPPAQLGPSTPQTAFERPQPWASCGLCGWLVLHVLSPLPPCPCGAGGPVVLALGQCVSAPCAPVPHSCCGARAYVPGGSVSPSRGAAGGSCGPGAPGLRHRDVRVGCEPGGAEAGLLQAGRSALHRGGGGASASRPAPASPRPACVLGREPAAAHSSCAGILPRVCRVRLPQGSRGQEFLLMAQRAPRSCSAWRVRPAPCLRDVSFDLGRIFSAMLSKCYCFCF